MPLRTSSNDEELNINLTPMIDVVMLLIIFFMVSTKFTNPERQFQIELPTVNSAQPLTTRPDELVVSVDREGKFFLGQEAVTAEELSVRLAEAQANYPEQVVMIRGDAQGNYQYVMDVLAICHQVKITNIKLANSIKAAPLSRGSS